MPTFMRAAIEDAYTFFDLLEKIDEKFDEIAQKERQVDLKVDLLPTFNSALGGRDITEALPGSEAEAARRQREAGGVLFDGRGRAQAGVQLEGSGGGGNVLLTEGRGRAPLSAFSGFQSRGGGLPPGTVLLPDGRAAGGQGGPSQAEMMARQVALLEQLVKLIGSSASVRSIIEGLAARNAEGV